MPVIQAQNSEAPLWTIISSVTNSAGCLIRTHLFTSTVSPLKFTVQFSWTAEGQFHKIVILSYISKFLQVTRQHCTHCVKIALEKNRIRAYVAYDLQVISVIISLLIKLHLMISKTSKEKIVKSKSSEGKVQNIREIYDAVFQNPGNGLAELPIIMNLRLT